MPPHPHPKIPPYPNPNMPPHNYQSMSPHSICLFPYCTYSNIYEPYGVARHPHIPPIGYIYLLPPNILLSPISPDILPPNFHPRSSRRITEHRGKRRNPHSNLMTSNMREARRIREDQEYQ